MVKDRLAELRLKGNVKSDSKTKLDKTDGSLDCGFLDEVSHLLQVITELRDHVNKVEIVQRDILAAPQQDAQLDDQLIQLTRTIRQKAYDVRTALKGFEDDANARAPLLTSTKERVKIMQHASVTRQFVAVMNTYNDIQVEYREKCKDRIRRKLNVAGYSFSEQELEDMLEKKNPEIFTQAIMADTEAAKRSLSDIEARHADIIRLEKSIEELRDLFMAVSLMVDQQSELIDRVEYNVNKAADCVVQAKGKLSSAVQQNKKSRRCKIICIIILIVLAILAIITIASAIGLT
ncbi:Syntaxin [Fasciola gigantica]|uniref:Syntaxin n=1 Tax=Fasciola gigantica TaxID=46835 RepID=A0A504YUM2_FASGI|nr:Syntaxin [Fasciola gigantica]